MAHDDEWLARPVVHVGILVVVAVLVCIVGVARQPLDGDPAMYATIAKTIARTGEWTHLTFNGDAYVNKPPLHFWLNALVFRVLGATTFSAVLLPGLLGVLDTLLLYVMCRVMLRGWRIAFAAALVYVTTPEVVHWSRGVHLETLVTFWVLLGILAAYWSVQHPAGVLLLGIAVAGGALAKGPQGFFPVGLAVVLWAHERMVLRRAVSGWAVAGAAVVLLAAGPWLWARINEGSGFAEAYFEGQIGNVLFAKGVHDRGPLWYVVKLGRTYWPWLPVALAGVVMLARRWRTSLAPRVWLLYGALVLLVISLAAGKKSRYLFQLYPALAVAAGFAIAAAAERVPRLLAGLVIAAGVAALVVATTGERVSEQQATHSRAALAIAARLDDDGEPVLITRTIQWGEPQFGKIIGFYGTPLLHACRATCEAEAAPGRRVVLRDEELAPFLRHFGATDDAVVARAPSLALVRVPPPRAR